MQLLKNWNHPKINQLYQTTKKFLLNPVFNITFQGFVFVTIMGVMIAEHSGYHGTPHWVYMFFWALDSLLVFVLATNYFKSYYELLKKRTSMDLLIALGVHISYFYSTIKTIINLSHGGLEATHMEFWEVVPSLLFFINFGHLLENKLRARSNIGIRELLKLKSRTANLVQADGTIVEVKSRSLKINDIIVVGKGQSIPVDGLIIEGKTRLDTSSMTGESLPRTVREKDLVNSGTINLENSIKVVVTKDVDSSTLSQIINKLERIIETKTPIERFSQKVVKYFIPAIVSIALLTFIIWAIVLNVAGDPAVWLKTWPSVGETLLSIYQQQGWVGLAIWISVTVVVIACPCAFGIAAPAAIYSSSGIAAKQKILYASAEVYEQVNQVKFVAFDKTGTLTQNKTRVLGYYGDRNLIDVAASIERHSSHPLAKGIVNYAPESKIVVQNVKEFEGLGMVGEFQNQTYEVISYKKALQKNYQNQIKEPIKEFGSTVAICHNQTIVGLFVIGDPIKINVKAVLDCLVKLKIEPVLISGDNIDVVKHLAEELNIKYYYGETTPESKATIIKELQKQGPLVFVGDGLNDVLAIKAANLGIAFASGSEITNELSDISLLENSVELVYKSLWLSKRTIKLIKINFIWAGIFNVICVPLAFTGVLPPWLGAILMVSSSIFLLLNTLLFKYFNNNYLKKPIESSLPAANHDSEVSQSKL